MEVQFSFMSLFELKEHAATLSARERLELAVYLDELDSRDEESFQRTAAQRMREMDTGRKVTMEQVEADHAHLSNKGQ